jgi:hypothetical protein
MMVAGSEDQVDTQRHCDPGKELEAYPFSESVLDHRQRRLTHARDLAEVRLCLEPHETRVAQIRSEVEDDRFDPFRLVA